MKTIFAARLREARLARGWSQSQLARNAGVPHLKHISAYECGNHVPHPCRRQELARALGVSIAWLTGAAE